MKPKLSMVIPTYTITKDLEKTTLMALATYRDQVDELIITEDGGFYSPAFAHYADAYIINTKNAGFTKNVNRGWQYATGDYVAIVNSDTYLMSGELYDLCRPGIVTSPEIVNQGIPRLAGPFWVTPATIAQQYGYLMEEMKTYASDSEYDNRIAHIFEKVPSVRIYHEMHQTLTAAGKEGGEENDRDNAAYRKLIAEGKAK